jgi:hypothetical protein
MSTWGLTGTIIWDPLLFIAVVGSIDPAGGRRRCSAIMRDTGRRCPRLITSSRLAERDRVAQQVLSSDLIFGVRDVRVLLLRKDGSAAAKDLAF